MKNKAIIVTIGLILASVLLFGIMPVAAADSPGTAAPRVTQEVGIGRLWVRILSVPDQSTLDSLVAKAEASGKITTAQAAKIEDFWTEYHAKFVKVVKTRVLQRLIRVKSEANLKTFLDKQVAAGKITATRESSIISLWESAHITA